MAAGVEARYDLGLRPRLARKIASNHRLELIEPLEDRDVERREEVEGKYDAAVSIDDEALHAAFTPDLHPAKRDLRDVEPVDHPGDLAAADGESARRGLAQQDL